MRNVPTYNPFHPVGLARANSQSRHLSAELVSRPHFRRTNPTTDSKSRAPVFDGLKPRVSHAIAIRQDNSMSYGGGLVKGQNTQEAAKNLSYQSVIKNFSWL